MRTEVQESLTYLALSFWLFLAGVHLSQAWQYKSLISLLLVLQSGLVAYFLTKRADSKAESPFYQEVSCLAFCPVATCFAGGSVYPLDCCWSQPDRSGIGGLELIQPG